MSTYPFVPAANDYGARRVPVRAFVVHMAEGGGTVGYLAKPNPNGVSAHYVIERNSGRIVQMLREDRISGSLRPTAIRTTDDAPHTSPDGALVRHGVTAAKAVMGEAWRDPNTAVISVEVEGFAATGPSGFQSAALAHLVADVRSRHPGMGLLAHRDFADYKACPGKLIRWGELGGHGPSEGDMLVYANARLFAAPRRFLTRPGTVLHGYDPARPGAPIVTRTWTTASAALADAEVFVSSPVVPKGGPFLRVTNGIYAGLLIVAGLVDLDPEPPAPTPDCADAIAADRAKARVTWED